MALRVLFFDVGYTLVNEDAVWRRRCREQAETEEAGRLGLTAEDLFRAIREASRARLPQYAAVIRRFHLGEAVPYRSELETLCPEAPETLRALSARYVLGVIANQTAGLEERLTAFGIRACFTHVVSSHDAGAAKPDPRIFARALALAGCLPGEACMIGDRLDNDIAPAKAAGMKTVWVRQGFGREQTPQTEADTPDWTVESLAGLLDIL